jgi:RHS repeat-associated protein
MNYGSGKVSGNDGVLSFPIEGNGFANSFANAGETDLQSVNRLSRSSHPSSALNAPEIPFAEHKGKANANSKAGFRKKKRQGKLKNGKVLNNQNNADLLTGIQQRSASVGVTSLSLTSGLPSVPVPNPIIRVPDLAVQEFKLVSTTPETMTFSWTVRNTTDPDIKRAAPMSAPWIDRLYLSSDRLVSDDDLIVLNSQGEPNRYLNTNNPVLAAGAEYTRTETLRLRSPVSSDRPFLLVSTNAIVENSARPREFDDGLDDGGNLQLGANNTVALNLVSRPTPPPAQGTPESPDTNPYNQSPNGCGTEATAPLTSEVEMHSGALIETHRLTGYQSMGINRGLTLRYDSTWADPRSILHFSYRDVMDIPTDEWQQLMIARLAVQRGSFNRQVPGHPGGIPGLVGGENFWSIPDSTTPQRIQAALQIDLRDQGSGIYQYTLQRGLQSIDPANLRFDPLATTDRGSIVSVNRINSAFGHGWSLSGWQELVVNPDNSVLLIDGNGTLKVFQAPTSGNVYQSPTGDHSRLERLSDGTFRRRLKDGTVYTFNGRNHLSEVRDRVGNRTQYTYNASGQLQQMIDPVGLATTFNYTGNRITSITDPSGRLTRLNYDAAGNLQRITDPDASSRTWEYDSQYRMTAETNQRGHREQVIYDAVTGRVDRAIRKDNSVVDVSVSQGRGLTSAAQSANILGAPSAWVPGAADAQTAGATYIDGRSNSVQMRLNRAGNMISSQDSLGNIESLERCGCGRIDATTDALGFTTRMTYDTRGNLIGTRDNLSSTNGQVFEYESTFNQLVRSVDELGRQTLYQRDSVTGNLLAMQQVVGAVGGTDDRITRFTYLSNGLVDTIVDPMGQVTDYDYDSRGRLITATFAKGTALQAIERYEYDAAGNQTAVIDANGNRTTFLYDSSNRLIQMIKADPDGAGSLTSPITSYAYDASGNVTQVTDARGNITRFEFDRMNRMTRQIEADPDGAGALTSPVTQYIYDANGNLVRTIDALGRDLYTSTYDARNRLVQLERSYVDTHWVGSPVQTRKVWKYTYDLNNNLTASLWSDSTLATFATTTQQTRWTYDARNRLIQMTEADPDRSGSQTSPITRYSYDAANQLIQGTNPNNQTTQYSYDELGQLIRITLPDPDGAGSQIAPVTFYSYDLAGNRIAATDPLGRVTRSQYDVRNRLTQVTLPDPDGAGTQVSAFTRYSYDAVGNVLTTSDALGQTTRSRYDALNRLIEITDPLNQVTRKSYDAVDNLTGITDSLNQRTSYTYDGLNRLIQDTNPLGFSRIYRYDAMDNLTEMVDRNGQRRAFTYDQRDLRTSERWLDSTGATIRTISYRHNLVSDRLDTAGDSASGDSFYQYIASYDDLGRITGSQARVPGVQLGAVSFRYTLDAVGNVLRAEDAFGSSYQGQIDYTYDGLNRVTSLTQRQNIYARPGFTPVAPKRVSMSYNTASELTNLTRFSDLNATQTVATTSYTYDQSGRLNQLTHSRNSNPLADYRLSYDATNRLTQLGTQDNTTNYSYDARSQLTLTDHSTQLDENYRYDANGNRTNTGYQTGTNNRLISDGIYTYQYDNEGNRTRRTHIADGTVDEYRWDYRQRLMGVTTRDRNGIVTRTVQYDYDMFDRRIGKTVDWDGAGAAPAQVERYVYDRDQIALVFDGNGNLTHRYLYAPGVDQVLAEERPGGNVRWALSDQQGSVRDVIDNAGNKLNQIRYDSFGTMVSQSNPNQSFRFGYTGRDYDAETGMNYYRARYYDARVGRFVSEDPIGFAAGDTNLSRYVFNSPMNATDPSGLIWDTVIDVGSIAYSFYTLANDYIQGCDENLSSNLWSLGADVAGALIPFATGLGSGVRGARHADGALDAARGLGGASDAGRSGGSLFGRGADSGAGGTLGIFPGGGNNPYGFGISRTGAGDGYASGILEGGTGRAFAGHGQYRFGTYPKDTIVPNGTTISVWTEPNVGISDSIGKLIEQGKYDELGQIFRTNPTAARNLTGARSYLPGAEVPNYHLLAPKDLWIYRSSITVEDATPLSRLLQPNMGHLDWAACTMCIR